MSEWRVKTWRDCAWTAAGAYTRTVTRPDSIWWGRRSRSSCRERSFSTLMTSARLTYIRLTATLSGTTRVSRYQKGKTNLDFTEARGSEWQWHQLGHMQVCTSLHTDNTPAPHCSVFYTPDALPAAQPTASKHWRTWNKIKWTVLATF